MTRLSQADQARLKVIRDALEIADERVRKLDDERQRTLVHWDLKRLRVALDSYEKRARAR